MRVALSSEDLLALYAYGELTGAAAEDVESRLDADRAAHHSLARFLALIPSVDPTPEVKARLLASIGGGRFETFTQRMAALFDVTADRARELLGLLERPASWEPRLPGLELVHFAGGRSYVTADCGFVRLAAGSVFPWHHHRGEERTLLLTGTLVEDSGTTWHAGDEIVQLPGSEHSLTAGADGALYASRAVDGIDVPGHTR